MDDARFLEVVDGTMCLEGSGAAPGSLSRMDSDICINASSILILFLAEVSKNVIPFSLEIVSPLSLDICRCSSMSHLLPSIIFSTSLLECSRIVLSHFARLSKELGLVMS